MGFVFGVPGFAQGLFGGSSPGSSLTISSNPTGSKGYIYFGTVGALNEATGYLGFGTLTPMQQIHAYAGAIKAGGPIDGAETGGVGGVYMGYGSATAAEGDLTSIRPGVTFQPLNIRASVIKLLSGSGAASERMRIDANGNMVFGTAAIATTATDGRPYMPSSAGAPTGVPTAYTGMSAFQYDTTNNKIWVYNGSWRGVVVA